MALEKKECNAWEIEKIVDGAGLVVALKANAKGADFMFFGSSASFALNF